MELYTVQEAADKMRMSVAWLRQRIFQKQIKHIKLGRRVFIPQETVYELLNTSIVEPKKIHH